MDEVKKLFRPEFLNRIDEIIVFHQLTQENIRDIVGIMFKQLAARVQQNAGIQIELTSEAAAFLAKEGFDAVFGARPLRRALQNQVEDALAEKILAGEIRKGDSVRIDLQNGALVFNSAVVSE